MDRLLSLQVFVAVGEEQSFSAAARRLALSPPAVTRAVGALEQALGVKLLQRTTRIVRLTEAGARYLVDCKRVLSELEDADQAVSGAQVEVRGTLAVTASVLFGRAFVAPLLHAFLKRHSKVNIRALVHRSRGRSDRRGTGCRGAHRPPFGRIFHRDSRGRGAQRGVRVAGLLEAPRRAANAR